MFVFMGTFKEGNANKTKQREREIDFERFRKRAVKWASAWKSLSENRSNLNCWIRRAI